MSAATIDRLLVPIRSASKKTKRKTPSVRASVPIRTFGDWKEPEPGFMEADLVAHCGGNMSGSFVHTLVLTDITTAWTECISIAVRDSVLVVEALRRLQQTLPFQLRGIDTDNGGEFKSGEYSTTWRIWWKAERSTRCHIVMRISSSSWRAYRRCGDRAKRDLPITLDLNAGMNGGREKIRSNTCGRKS